MNGLASVVRGGGLVLLCLFGSVATATAAWIPGPVDNAIEVSKRTGMPILAIAGSADDAWSIELKALIADNRNIQTMMSQVVYLELDAYSTQWQKWASKYNATGAYIPLVYVIRADGKQLYGKSGFALDTLEQFLSEQLAGAGKLLSAKQMREITKNLDDARKAITDGNLQMASEKISRYANSGSFAEVALDTDKVVAELAVKGKAKFEDADKNMHSASQKLDGALALLEANRIFGKLPPLKDLVLKVANYRRDPDTKELFIQADLLDQAKVLEAKSQFSKARKLYEQVWSRFPGTPAARMAQTRLGELPEKPATAEKAEK
jgi:hypothetical protein